MVDDYMLAFGSCIAGIGIFVTALLALLFRHPNAPRWTRPEIVPMLVCVPVTVTTGFGLGYVALGVSRLVKGTGDPRELLLVVGVLITMVLVWRGLQIRRRLKDYAAATGGIAPSAYLATEPTLVVDEPRRSPPTPHARQPAHGAA